MHDIVIIGAGVAGSYIAQQLSDEYDVLVIDKGHPKIKDSGIVSRKISTFFKLRPIVKKRITKLELVSPSGYVTRLVSNKPFAYLLHRERLTRILRSGLNIVNEMFRAADFFNDHVHVWTDESDYTCKLLVDCSGAVSTLKISRSKTFFGMLNRSKPFAGNIKVFLNKYFSPDFFAWEIPTNGEHGLITSYNVIEYFKYFQKSVEFHTGYQEIHPIAIGIRDSFANRRLIVGEACGQVKPLTGGGIIFSLLGAKRACEIIRLAFGLEDFSKKILSIYEKNWHNDLKREITCQLFIRNLYRKTTNKQLDKMIKILGEKIEISDYDKLSNVFLNIPKLRLIKLLITLLFR